MNAQAQPIRCLLAMLGTDVHSKGIRTLAQLLKDRGVEVIYLGEHNTPDGIVNALLAEDPDVLGLSFSTATYLHYTRMLLDTMKRRGAEVPVMIGGLIHDDDHAELKALGVRGIFGPGTSIDDVWQFLQHEVGSGARR